MNKRVLITGAAGFLGSHLCDKFIAEGCDDKTYCIGLSKLSTTGRKSRSSKCIRLDNSVTAVFVGVTISCSVNSL